MIRYLYMVWSEQSVRFFLAQILPGDASCGWEILSSLGPHSHRIAPSLLPQTMQLTQRWRPEWNFQPVAFVETGAGGSPLPWVMRCWAEHPLGSMDMTLAVEYSHIYMAYVYRYIHIHIHIHIHIYIYGWCTLVYMYISYIQCVYIYIFITICCLILLTTSEDKPLRGRNHCCPALEDSLNIQDIQEWHLQQVATLILKGNLGLVQ